LYALIAQFTKVPTRPARHDGKPINVAAGGYNYINLNYMKEVSGGNKGYEKTVTEQFIETIPTDLLSLEQAWKEKRISDMRKVAHNMRTTVSIMGLNETLQSQLDALEYDNLSNETFTTQFNFLKSVCEASVEEAKLFLVSI
jgi:hypothetical protein